MEFWFVRHSRCQDATLLFFAPEGFESYYTAKADTIPVTTPDFLVQDEYCCQLSAHLMSTVQRKLIPTSKFLPLNVAADKMNTGDFKSQQSL